MFSVIVMLESKYNIKPTGETLETIKHDGLSRYPNEACGFVVLTSEKKQVVIPCKNYAGEAQGENMFIMDGSSRAIAEMRGTILWIYHTHPHTSPVASEADMIGCFKSKIPWLILSPHSGEYTILDVPAIAPPTPLIGRNFVWGVFDCYALVRDYYARELAIDLPDYDRGLLFDWDNGEWDKFSDLFTEAGFYALPDGVPLQKGDVFLMAAQSNKINHCAVLVDPDKSIFYHHFLDHLSKESIYGGWYREVTRLICRYVGADRRSDRGGHTMDTPN